MSPEKSWLELCNLHFRWSPENFLGVKGVGDVGSLLSLSSPFFGGHSLDFRATGRCSLRNQALEIIVTDVTVELDALTEALVISKNG